MQCFIGLKSKLYTFVTEDNYESRKAKGINKNLLHDELKYDDCKNVCSIDLYETQNEQNWKGRS